jgi:hypothetical protein
MPMCDPQLYNMTSLLKSLLMCSVLLFRLLTAITRITNNLKCYFVFSLHLMSCLRQKCVINFIGQSCTSLAWLVNPGESHPVACTDRTKQQSLSSSQPASEQYRKSQLTLRFYRRNWMRRVYAQFIWQSTQHNIHNIHVSQNGLIYVTGIIHVG